MLPLCMFPVPAMISGYVLLVAHDCSALPCLHITKSYLVSLFVGSTRNWNCCLTTATLTRGLGAFGLHRKEVKMLGNDRLALQSMSLAAYMAPKDRRAFETFSADQELGYRKGMNSL